MKKRIFITGIGTDVGKTIASAIVVEALKADYWKPIQAGDIENGDLYKIKALISNKTSQIHPNSYLLKTPMSPHAAAVIDGVKIDLDHIITPKTTNDLVVEGAGGILVPLNEKETILDLIQSTDKVVVVSRHYLGSINHTLMTIKLLQEKGLEVSVIFNGEENKTTEEIIVKLTGVSVIGRIDKEPYFDKNVIKEYAELFKKNLKEL